MPEDERPPEHIWLLDERLNDHFASIKARREAGLRGVDTPAETDMSQNELTKGLT